MSQERFIGVVKWFNTVKGYGFIGVCEKTEEWPLPQNKDVFVHYTGITASGYKKLAENDVVEFSIENGANNQKQAAQVVNLAHEAK